ncbi:MAG TPA: twin-arginine translocation signal domain-containing protein, partial [Pyrinomonadaceae bacterium]|nr:twin-arginine translocation signal domain-containing protein [Pyrinomonadaceae bacterium]
MRVTRETISCNLERRSFLREVCAAAAAAGIFGIGLRADALTGRLPADAPATHNMLVVGEKAAYLSHLPMFRKLNQAGTSYLTPHRYQVLLEATFSSGGKDLGSVYTEDRAKNQAVKIYTLSPEEFVLPQLNKSAAAPSPLGSFKGTVFRGHLERGGQPIDQLADI